MGRPFLDEGRLLLALQVLKDLLIGLHFQLEVHLLSSLDVLLVQIGEDVLHGLEASVGRQVTCCCDCRAVNDREI